MSALRPRPRCRVKATPFSLPRMRRFSYFFAGGFDGGDVTVPVDTGAPDGAGGGGGRVRPCCLTTPSARDRGPPGALCCCAVCANDTAGASDQRAMETHAQEIFSVMTSTPVPEPASAATADTAPVPVHGLHTPHPRQPNLDLCAGVRLRPNYHTIDRGKRKCDVS